MKRRFSAVATLAGLFALTSVSTAWSSVPTSPLLGATSNVLSTPASNWSANPFLTVEETINVDWRVLAGLDYATGKATDTLKKLDGKLIRVPGFVVPLDDFQEDGAEFLLVPYYGACVHTPPPPPNQIVMVEMAGRKSIKLNLFDAIWMSGRLKIASIESPYGTVGYQLEGTKVEPYSSK